MQNPTGLRDVAIVGIGATPYYKRGESLPKSITELAGEAILAACDDAGFSVRDIDGFAYYSGASAGYTEKMDTADFMETLGIPEVRFTAALTSAVAAPRAPSAWPAPRMWPRTPRRRHRHGAAAVQKRLGSGFRPWNPTPSNSFLQPSGLVGPGQLMSVLGAPAHAPLRHPPRSLRRDRDLARENAMTARDGDACASR